MYMGNLIYDLYTSMYGSLTVKIVKGLRWMPWHQESMKDVDGCDKPR